MKTWIFSFLFVEMLKLRGTSRELSFSVFALPLKIGTASAATHLAEKIHNHIQEKLSLQNHIHTGEKPQPHSHWRKIHNHIHSGKKLSLRNHIQFKTYIFLLPLLVVYCQYGFQGTFGFLRFPNLKHFPNFWLHCTRLSVQFNQNPCWIQDCLNSFTHLRIDFMWFSLFALFLLAPHSFEESKSK